MSMSVFPENCSSEKKFSIGESHLQTEKDAPDESPAESVEKEEVKVDKPQCEDYQPDKECHAPKKKRSSTISISANSEKDTSKKSLVYENEEVVPVQESTKEIKREKRRNSIKNKKIISDDEKRLPGTESQKSSKNAVGLGRCSQPSP